MPKGMYADDKEWIVHVIVRLERGEQLQDKGAMFYDCAPTLGTAEGLQDGLSINVESYPIAEK